MKISTRFVVTGLFCAVAATLIGVALVASANRVTEELLKNRAAADIVEAVAGLRYLTLEYARQPEERVEAQWATRNRSLGKLLESSVRFESRVEQVSLDLIREAYRDSTSLFSELVDAQRARRAAADKREVLDELLRRLTAATVNKTSVMMTEAFRLQDMSRNRVSAAQGNALLIVIVLSAILVLVVAASMFLASRSIARPLMRLREGAELVGAGNLEHRIGLTTRDEIGELAREFDDMSAKLMATTVSRDKLAESEVKLQAQLARLDLLNHITRAIGERQDLQSIFQVVIRSLEDNAPVDFSCVCLHDPVGHSLTVVGVGVKSAQLAMDLAMGEQAHIPIDENGLSRCVRGELVHEPDIGEVPFPFPQRLARGGLHSLVVAPLLVESKVFGVLVAARKEPRSFSSGECEFLRQLSEHVGLASHQSQLYSALQQAYDDLRQTQQAVMQQERLRALGQMASGIAHDINNAISPVALYTESLLETEPNLSARARDRLEIIQRAIDDVAHTVARMREFYRQREPQLTLAPMQVNLLVNQVLDLTRARWSDMPQRRGTVIRLETKLADGIPAIMGVESELREALINLVFNAVDAMPDGGTLTLQTAVAGDSERGHVQISVTDSGAGMDEETRRRCLEPFFTTKGERGTGLGLAMVYGVVRRHSAELEIESAPGKGTTMRLSFPVSAVVPATPGPAAAALLQAKARLRLLLVDDDPLLLKSLQDALGTDGHVIATANDGQAGIDTFRAALARAEPFDAVITDLGMPYVDGRKVADAIKAVAPSTPVILLTGWGQRLVAEGDIPPHVDRVLSKPPKLRELREALAGCGRSATSLSK